MLKSTTECKDATEARSHCFTRHIVAKLISLVKYGLSMHAACPVQVQVDQQGDVQLTWATVLVHQWVVGRTNEAS